MVPETARMADIPRVCLQVVFIIIIITIIIIIIISLAGGGGQHRAQHATQKQHPQQRGGKV